MTHGQLTLLGGQLRSVLVVLRPTAQWSRQWQVSSSHVRRRGLASRSPVGRQHAFATAPEEERAGESLQDDGNGASRTLSNRHLRRRSRIDWLATALKEAGKEQLAPVSPLGKLNVSYLNVASRSGRQAYAINRRRHAQDTASRLSHTRELSLQRIIASFVQHQTAAKVGQEAGWVTPFDLARDEAAFLSSKGYSVEDIEAWAQILTVEDSEVAASLLTLRVSTHGLHGVPLSVYTYLLRRKRVGAKAIRMLLDHARKLFRLRSEQTETAHDMTSLFVVFLRLLRHAREVSPLIMSDVVSLLLGHLRAVPHNNKRGIKQPLQRLTYMLNKALRLVSLPTAAQPFKNIGYQEEAMVTILRFMAEHHPALQINCEGYRAVTAIQLAQGKTPGEQQWAELKALSWPPWKEDRTAMDAEIQAESHGITRAGNTLRQMQQAGYRMGKWEKAAQLYAGWDVDSTPTIQARVQLSIAGDGVLTGSAVWVARIKSTRTAQEAWACFLAYEDAKLPPQQDVFLAIFEVLYQGQRRQWREQNIRRPESGSRDSKPKLYPGDAKEVSPLPPSTHLYTHTRTAPPTVEALAGQLQDRGILFEGYCLAFLVARASSLQTGVDYLQRATSRSPALHNMLYLTPPLSLTGIRLPIFTAYIELLCRFSNVPTSRALARNRHTHGVSRLVPPVLDGLKLNLYHPLVHAVWLLQHRRPAFLPAWHPVLEALGRESSLATIHVALTTQKSWQQPIGDELSEDMKSNGAILAYRLLRHVLQMMKGLHLDLDETVFLCHCRTLENLGYGCWKLLLVDQARLGQTCGAFDSDAVRRASATLNDTSIVGHLIAALDSLTGEDGDEPALPRTPHDVARGELVAKRTALLHVPNPGTLHAFIRALGWMSALDQFVRLVRWMVEHWEGLAERQEKHRNGDVLMRRAVIAIRVFLERSWLGTSDGQPTEQTVPEGPSSNHGEQQSAETRSAQLRRLECAASPAMVDEVRAMVESVEEWGDWPSDEEVQKYCEDGKFEQIQKYYN